MALSTMTTAYGTGFAVKPGAVLTRSATRFTWPASPSRVALIVPATPRTELSTPVGPLYRPDSGVLAATVSRATAPIRDRPRVIVHAAEGVIPGGSPSHARVGSGGKRQWGSPKGPSSSWRRPTPTSRTR